MYPSNAAVKRVRWKSSNKKVATIVKDTIGVNKLRGIKVKKKGRFTLTLTVKGKDGAKKKAKVRFRCA